MPDFQQTVDLKEKLNKDKSNNTPPKETKKTAKLAPRPGQKKEKSRERTGKEERNSSIDEVYSDHDEVAPQGDLRTFHRPVNRSSNDSVYKTITIILTVVLIFSFAYFFFFKDSAFKGEPQTVAETDSGWYAVKLTNDQMYYGQVENKSADPLVIKNVYYNYDQLNKEEDAGNESGNLRLVKRGKETHGPDGTMDIIRSQVVYIEPLKEDSKVLKAILDYEN